jgi:hypothetical protein
MQALAERLNIVEVERFIMLLLRESLSFDYTEWQRDLWKDQSIAEIGQKAKAHWEATHPKSEQ